MVGAAYDDPFLFASVDKVFFDTEDFEAVDRHQVVERMLPYIEQWTRKGLKLHKITRHMLQLFSHQPGSRAWKRHLTENSCRDGADVTVVQDALASVSQAEIAAKRVILNAN